MKNLFGWMLAALLALTVGVSCSDDDDLNEGAGIASPAWKAENQAVIEGEALDFEFTAEGRWTAGSSALGRGGRIAAEVEGRQEQPCRGAYGHDHRPCERIRRIGLFRGEAGRRYNRAGGW